MKVRDIVKRLKADGWESVGMIGSHEQFTHPTKPGKVTVPSGPRRQRRLEAGHAPEHRAAGRLAMSQPQ